MEVEIISEPEWYVVGMSFYGDPFSQASGWSEDNEIGMLWKRFMACMKKDPESLKHRSAPESLLEIHIWDDGTLEKGEYEVFAGARVERLEAVPLACCVKILPATDYAVMTLTGSQITSDWSKTVYGQWLPSAGYVSSHSYCVECYDKRFKGLDQIEGSSLDVYVPVRKA